MKLNKIFTILSLAFLTLLPLASQAKEDSGTVVSLPVEKASISRDGDEVNVKMTLRLDRLKMQGNKAYLFTPYIVNGEDSLELQQIGVYSRNRWIHYEREGRMLGDLSATSLRYAKDMPMRNISETVDFLPWMEGAHLAVKGEVFECCNRLVAEQILDLMPEKKEEPKREEFIPQYFPYAPLTEVLAVVDRPKTRELSGRAYIDYPVNQTVIYPDYRNNRYELNKIIATIDSVRNDKDVTVNLIHISGTASPEGSYQNNVRLAKGRTEALKNYVQNLYNFPYGFITTSYEPVDWAGLKDFLVNGPVGPAYANIAGVNLNYVLPNRYNILNIVEGNVEPYQRNQNIKNNYPQEYQWLLQNVYPALRHSDYRIEYSIREFTQISEIEELIHTNPGKLNFKEMMTLANSYVPGSEKFNDVMEIAVRMYPEEPVANLNVANAALVRGDLATAERFLPNAGNSPEAILARANLAFLKGDTQGALQLYRQAAEYLPEAQKAYDLLLNSPR